MSLCITFLTHDLYKLLLDWDFPKENFSWTFFLFWLSRNHFRYCPWMISTTLIDVVNTIWETTTQCCPYGNSTPGHSAMKMNRFQSSLPLLIVGVFEKKILTFCPSTYCLKAWFQVIRNDWQNLFWYCNFEVCTQFQVRKTILWKVSGGLWEVYGFMVIVLVSRYQAVWVQALAGDIVLCFWTRHLHCNSLSASLST